jgi:TfoX/Sxy family transcriptional regulator of competence genes
MNMFGGVAAMVNGYMMGGLFGRSALVRLSQEDQNAALALDGAEPFDPMGKGAPMKDTIFLPETVMDEPDELKGWLRRALEYTASLPPKKKKGATNAKPAAKAKAAKAKPATKAPAKAARSTAAKRAPAAKARPKARRAKRR